MESLVIVLQRYVDEIELRNLAIAKAATMLSASVFGLLVAVAIVVSVRGGSEPFGVRIASSDYVQLLPLVVAVIFFVYALSAFLLARRAFSDSVIARSNGLKNLRYMFGNSAAHPAVLEIVKVEFARLDKLLAKRRVQTRKGRVPA